MKKNLILGKKRKYVFALERKCEDKQEEKENERKKKKK